MADPIHRRVVVVVLGGHLFLCLYLAFASSDRTVHTTKPLVVNTIVGAQQQPQPQPRPVKPPPHQPPPHEKPPPPVPRPVEPPVHQPPHREPPPSSAPQRPPQKPKQGQPTEPALQDKRMPKKGQQPPKKQNAQRQQMQKQLLKQLEEELSSIERKAAPTARPPHAAPLKLAIESAATDSIANYSHGYEDQLIAFLQRSLHLPDHGEVRLQLVVNGNGTLSKLLVIKAESEKNRKYLEENLPRLRFPPPEGGKERSLLMTFFNESN